MEELAAVGPTKEPQSTQTNTAKLEILSADSTLVVPEDSLSLLPKEPSPITIDSMKAPEPVATPDST